MKLTQSKSAFVHASLVTLSLWVKSQEKDALLVLPLIKHFKSILKATCCYYIIHFETGIQVQAVPKALKGKPKIFTGQKHSFQSKSCVFCKVSNPQKSLIFPLEHRVRRVRQKNYRRKIYAETHIMTWYMKAWRMFVESTKENLIKIQAKGKSSF